MALDLTGLVQVVGAASAAISGGFWVYSANKQVPLKGLMFLSGPPKYIQDVEAKISAANGTAAWFAGFAALCQAFSTYLTLTAEPPKCDPQSCIVRPALR